MNVWLLELNFEEAYEPGFPQFEGVYSSQENAIKSANAESKVSRIFPELPIWTQDVKNCIESQTIHGFFYQITELQVDRWLPKD